MVQPTIPLFQNLPSPYREFYEFHGVQLIGVNFPPSVELLKQLYDKLVSQTYDSGAYFQILENEEKRTYQVQAVNSLQKNDKLFIIDHAISFRYPDLRKLLASNDNLNIRLLKMLNFWENKQEPKDKLPNPTYDFVQEFENMEITDPSSVDINEECITLSFYSNNLENLEAITKILNKHKKLKALWLNDNPIEHNEALLATVEKDFPNIEILNSKFTSNAGEWAFKFATFSGDFSKINSIEIKDMKYFNFKDRNVLAIKDASTFEKIKGVRRINLLGHELPDLTTTNKFFGLLKSLDKLRELICETSVEEILFDLYEKGKLKDINDNLKVVNGFTLSYGRPTPHQKTIEKIVSNIWRISNTYRLSSSTKLDESSIWYVMDELGSAIEHDDDPNTCVVPFLFAPHNKLDEDMISFSIMWPIKDLTAGDFINRDYLNGMDESKFRKERSFCWFNNSIEQYFDIYSIHSKILTISTANKRKIAEEFLEVKKTEKKRNELQPNGISEKRPLGVATDMEYVIENLKREEFKIVQTLEEATILFLNENIKENFNQIAKTHFFNQFPYESCIVMKHNLARTVFQGLGRVNWIQETFDLEVQLKEFMGCYFENEVKCKNNLWIIKPPNLARSMDMIVTDNLDTILRLLETGPRLAQKYIHKPLTLRGNKIDLRYIVLVRGINPLEVFLYKTFWIRTSNNKYSIDKRSLEIYETHFTVMNYGHQLTQIHYYDFIKEFEQENKGKCEWNSVHERIKTLVKELFVSVALTYPQMANENARAVYGMDVMIDERNYQPKLLEMTFSPDCQRACKYNPTFYDDVFACLFLHKDDTRVERVI